VYGKILAIVIVLRLEAEPSAETIMARVAENQARSERLRSSFVYQQKVLVWLHDSRGKLVREESREYLVTPTPDGTKKELTASRERARPGKLAGMDADIAHDMRDELTNDRKSKDGLNRNLFPLTAAEQRKYSFRLAGDEVYRGLPVYRITFAPKDSGGAWKGEVLVSRDECQPVLVATQLAHKLPLLVRTALGTNLHGAGFSVRYQKFDDGVWFPVSYGTEFRVRALFFYNRSIVVSLENAGFQRARVSSRIEFAEAHSPE
jgi:hypothetical protein